MSHRDIYILAKDHQHQPDYNIFQKCDNTDRLNYIRGIFDRDYLDNYGSNECYFNCRDDYLAKLVSEFLSHITHSIQGNTLTFKNTNMIDFLGTLYDKATVFSHVNKQKYISYLGYMLDGSVPTCKIIKTDVNAVTPYKKCASDEGYDLTLIKIDKIINSNTIRYDTGIKLIPELGWHVEVLPRSSLSNIGYMLSNSVGLIDTNYRGNILVTITKINENETDIKLPFRGFQFVLRRNIHFILEEASQDSDELKTNRGDGGFGSTNPPN
jgi:dUTP pyrophosphatase